MKIQITFCLTFLVSLHLFAQAVLVEENGRKISSSSYVSSRNGNDFKNNRKIGAGISLAGVQGLVGANIEINFSSETALITSFGLAEDFNSFGFSIKRSLNGKYFSPYLSGGFTRWYSGKDNGSIKSTTPGFLGNKFLSSKELSTGNFAETLLYPALGIQYLQLDGEWAGSSLFAEVVLLFDIDDFQTAPTGSVGYLYYF